MWKTTDVPREAARVDFSFWGKKEKVKPWSVRKEHLYFIYCPPYSKWNSETDFIGVGHVQ